MADKTARNGVKSHVAHSKLSHHITTCSKILKNYVIQVLIIYIVSGVGKGCKFPQYLETTASWTANYKDEGAFLGYFQGSHLKASRCDREGTCLEYQRKCLSKISDEKFEVQHISKDSNVPTQYLCMQFLKRSESIIQIKESAELPFRNPNACNDDQLTLDNWPLVTSEGFYNQKVPCPFSGGYNIRLHTSDAHPTCPKELIPPRLESECEQDDGITIDFRNRKCMAEGLDMSKYQSLFCAATWTHGKFTFIILRPQEDSLQAWCLRITGTNPLNRIEHGHLFLDFVCDPGDGNSNIRETSNYLYIEFEQRIINSICADLSSFCEDVRLCEHELGLYCPKSCGSCNGDPNPCSFPAQFLGHWAEDRHDGKKYVNVTYYGLTLSDAGRFLCNEKEGHDFENGTMLLQTFDNGCFPRFACLEIRKPSSSTLEYRLGNRQVWPIKNWDNLKSGVCDEEMFRPNTKDKLRLGKKITEKPTQVLIDTQDHYPVHCQLNEWAGYRESQLYIKEAGKCDYCLVYDSRHQTSKLMKTPLNCSLKEHDYKCIGVFSQDENTHAVITRTLHVHQEYLCWVFVFDSEEADENEHAIVYVLNATNCNKVAIEAVKSGNLAPNHKYIMPKNPPKPCQHLKRTPVPETTNAPRIPTTSGPIYYHDDDSTPAQSKYPTSGAAQLHQYLTFIFSILFVIMLVKHLHR